MVNANIKDCDHMKCDGKGYAVIRFADEHRDAMVVCDTHYDFHTDTAKTSVTTTLAKVVE